MTSTLTKPCPHKSDPRPENRVVGSGGFTFSCTWSTWSQTPDTHREIETTSTTTVSGALEWLSKDPIGISGGLNQYVFCGNNPVNRRDPFGLCEDQDITQRMSSADLWLRQHHPELYEGFTPLFFPDTMPFAGFYWGEWGQYRPVSINRWYDMDQDELVMTMAHELMHAQLGPAWYNIFLIKMDPEVHEQIYQRAADIALEYNQWECRR